MEASTVARRTFAQTRSGTGRRRGGLKVGAIPDGAIARGERLPEHRIALLVVEVRVPHVDDQTEARFDRFIPYLVLKGVIEDRNLALDPLPRRPNTLRAWSCGHGSADGAFGNDVVGQGAHSRLSSRTLLARPAAR